MDDATQRLFFALWPEQPTAAAFAALAQDAVAECGGRATASDNLHLTLAFLGDQPSRIAHQLTLAAGHISSPAFDLVFDRVGSWRKSEIIWAGVQNAPASLTALRSALARALAASGIALDDRFAVHVTLARRADAITGRALTVPITWRVNAFALVASELSSTGPRYRVLSRWPLAKDT
jgi:RNA 2',3'-cyclic 3'-phosphodiesterase